MTRSRFWTFSMLLLLAVGACAAFNGQTAANHKELTGDPWYSRRADKVGEYFTFYFFNPDGDGIYRFGKLGKVLTERYSWKVSGGRLTLKFRNTGEKFTTGFRVSPADGGRKRLTLEKDPREHGRPFAYFRKDAGDIVKGAGWTTTLDGQVPAEVKNPAQP
ncbi:MAG: hypothetical protein HY303_17355 [Candidatus Wallbacteria bacterium]|nr:hypothetical protein [Candidatus Wallbacteria bacterium]